MVDSDIRLSAPKLSLSLETSQLEGDDDGLGESQLVSAGQKAFSGNIYFGGNLCQLFFRFLKVPFFYALNSNQKPHLSKKNLNI